MKKIFLICALALTSLTMKASVADLFSVDKAAISSEMTDLNALESFVQMNEGVTLADVQATSSMLTANVLTTEQSPFSQASILRGGGDAPLGIPSILWGFCFNVPGVVIVYLISEDNGETKKAFIGCVASSLLYIVVEVLLYGAWATSL